MIFRVKGPWYAYDLWNAYARRQMSSQVKNYSPVYMKQNASKKYGRGLPTGWAGCASACGAPAAGRLRGLSVRAQKSAECSVTCAVHLWQGLFHCIKTNLLQNCFQDKSEGFSGRHLESLHGSSPGGTLLLRLHYLRQH